MSRSLVLDPGRESLISSSGALLLQRDDPGRGPGPRAVAGAVAVAADRERCHDPGKVLLDVAIAVALGGDCLADLAAVRAQPDGVRAGRLRPDGVAGVRRAGRRRRRRGGRDPGARAQARAAVWARRRPLAGAPGRRDGGQVIVDIDATLVTAHSDKEGAEPTFKRGLRVPPDVRVRRPRRARHRRDRW